MWIYCTGYNLDLEPFIKGSLSVAVILDHESTF